MDRAERLTKLAQQEGAQRSAVISVKDIPFRREFRAACEQNSCGKYGKCWMCPPDVGDIDEMIDRARTYDRAFVFQNVGQLEDSFDIDGMEAAARNHNNIAHRLWESVAELYDDLIPLGAGACHVCERCARTEEQPCRVPDRAISSLESYGIAVSELAPLCGMKYINGTNTVTYFGAFLLRESGEAAN